VFFNALEGGRQIPAATVQNVKILGARGFQIMLHVRLPYVMAWTFAALPNAIAFGIVSVVTAEILSGGVGLGGLLSQAINTVDSTLTFAIVTILAVVGATAVIVASRLRVRVLHWLPGAGEAGV
jgi:NitT/TauT family transport system permease protein